MADPIIALRDILQSNWSKPPEPSIEDIADLDKNTVFKGGKKKSEKRRQWEVYSVVDGEQRFTYESLMNGVLDG